MGEPQFNKNADIAEKYILKNLDKSLEEIEIIIENDYGEHSISGAGIYDIVRKILNKLTKENKSMLKTANLFPPTEKDKILYEKAPIKEKLKLLSKWKGEKTL